MPFYLYVGLAASEDGGETFQEISAARVLERSAINAYLTASPSVLVEDGWWRKWSASGTGWSEVDGRPRHHYLIKYAESSDGVEWRRDGTVCIDYTSLDKYALAGPCVAKDGTTYGM
jgi:hypothetical protein